MKLALAFAIGLVISTSAFAKGSTCPFAKASAADQDKKKNAIQLAANVLNAPKLSPAFNATGGNTTK
jgi:hypothetical protein